jgi:hypothetical protein
MSFPRTITRATGVPVRGRRDAASQGGRLRNQVDREPKVRNVAGGGGRCSEIGSTLAKRTKSPSVVKDRQVTPLGDRTDQEVRIRARHDPGAAGVEVCRGTLVVGGAERFVSKRLELIAELLERGRDADATEELLPDWPNHRDSAFVDKRTQFPHGGVIELGATAKRQGPYRRVDEHLHWRRRCFL